SPSPNRASSSSLSRSCPKLSRNVSGSPERSFPLSTNQPVHLAALEVPHCVRLASACRAGSRSFLGCSSVAARGYAEIVGWVSLRSTHREGVVGLAALDPPCRRRNYGTAPSFLFVVGKRTHYTVMEVRHGSPNMESCPARPAMRKFGSLSA